LAEPTIDQNTVNSEEPSTAAPIEDAYDRELIANVRPPAWRNPLPRNPYQLLVIGAGPAGLMAARTAAMLGASVALIERDRLGGNSLNWASVPSKALIRTSQIYADMSGAAQFGAEAPANIQVNFTMAMDRIRRIRAIISRADSAARLTNMGIDLFFGSARFTGPDSVEVAGVCLRFKKAMIATGSRSKPVDIPGLPECGYLHAADAFRLKTLPQSILVIGGGPGGCEGAQTFARLGARTIIAMEEPLFLPQEERDAAHMVSDALARDGVEIHLNTRAAAVRVEAGRKVVDLVNDGELSTITVDGVFVGTGRDPVLDGLDLDKAGVISSPASGIQVDDFLRTTNPKVYAAGDVCLEHKITGGAYASGRLVVRNALFPVRRRMSALTIPWCTYTDPEIAHVGLYVKQARERDIPVKTFTVPMHDVDRAVIDGDNTGFVKIHIRDGSDKILGATIVARHAGEMINEMSLAVEAGIGLKQIARVVRAYPTQAEAVRMAADHYNETRLTPLHRRLLRMWLGRT
jgi:pyruvate/2-oxoglutarate dehydrogenase complex dihydrolipoamide dehydrogenase (E3) component